MILFKNIDYLNEDFEWIKNVNIIIKDNKIDQIIDDVEKIDL